MLFNPIGLLLVAILVVVAVKLTFKVLPEYERGVIFRLGRIARGSMAATALDSSSSRPSSIDWSESLYVPWQWTYRPRMSLRRTTSPSR